MSEDDPIHIGTVGDFDGGELSYPTYINYDARLSTEPVEDIHYGGQIISHYLVALTKLIKSRCSLNLDQSQELVIRILIESFSELGDISGRGTDSAVAYSNLDEDKEFRVNLSPDHALEWINVNKPITYRNLAQKMAKFQKAILVDDLMGAACPAKLFTIDDIERTVATVTGQLYQLFAFPFG